MDDWGDPWADHSSPPKRPPAIEILGASNESPVVTPVLGGFFENEAQWGNEEEADAFGGWAGAQSPTNDEPPNTKPFTPDHDHRTAPDSPAKAYEEASPKRHHNADAFEANPFADTAPSSDAGPAEGKAAIEQPTPTAPEVDSSASDSATTIVPDSAGSVIVDSVTSSGTIQSEGFESEASTRASTAPSDASHALSESTRTSFEEEGGVRKAVESEGRQDEAEDSTTEAPAGSQEEKEEEDDDDFGDFEEEVENEADVEQEHSPPIASQDAPSAEVGKSESQQPLDTKVAQSGLNFQPDLALLTKIFPPAESTSQLEPAADTPIASRNARKTWYRLTRKETMREFESGSTDDNYVRVGWGSSRIRSEVLKTVSKWQTEERLNKQYGKPGALFGWDNPGSPTVHVHRDVIAGRHKRQTSAAAPVKHILEEETKPRPQSLVLPSRRRSSVADPAAVAQFSWSSSQGSAEPPKSSRSTLSFQPTLDSIAGSAPPTKTTFGNDVQSSQPSPPLPIAESSTPTSAPSSKTTFSRHDSQQGQSSHMGDVASAQASATSAPPTQTTFDTSGSQQRPSRPTSLISPHTERRTPGHSRSASSVSISSTGSASKIAQILEGSSRKEDKAIKSPAAVVKNSTSRAVPTSPLAVEIPREELFPEESPWRTASERPVKLKPLDIEITKSSADAPGDDDEWGDMMESPAVTTPAALPDLSNPWQTTSSPAPLPSQATVAASPTLPPPPKSLAPLVISQTNSSMSLPPPQTKSVPKLAPLDTTGLGIPGTSSLPEDDDEWGEMVQSPAPSSPAVSSPALVPLPTSPWGLTPSPTSLNPPMRIPTPMQRPHPPSPLIPAPIRSATMPNSGFPFAQPRASSPLTRSPKPPTLVLPPQPKTPANPDPWASADFSVFEKPKSGAGAPRSQTPNPLSSAPRHVRTHTRNASSPMMLTSPPRQANSGSTAVTFDQILQPAGALTKGPTFDSILRSTNANSKPQPAQSISSADVRSPEQKIHRRATSEEKVPRRTSDASLEDFFDTGLKSPPPFVTNLDAMRSPPRRTDDDIVRSIIRNLPDLEYMLR